MSQLTRRIVWVVCTLSLAVACGCGEGKSARPKLGKVKGVVKYKGKPISGAVVAFNIENAPRAAVGMTDANGNYRLTTYDTHDGAIIGTHKVTVSKPVTNTFGKEPDKLNPEDLQKAILQNKVQEVSKLARGELPGKYADIKTTPLQFTIDAGDNEKNIDLED